MKNLNKSSVKDATTNATLDRIVSEYRSAIKKITTCSDTSMDDTMATILCNSMCGNLDICNSIVSVCSPIGNHYVLALELEEKYYILDVTFNNYIKGANYKITEKNLVERFNCLPSFFIIKNENGRDFMDELLKNGYFECTEQNMKLYCDGFVLSCYNKNKKNKDIVYNTNITGEEYLSSMVLRKMIGSNGRQKIK